MKRFAPIFLAAVAAFCSAPQLAVAQAAAVQPAPMAGDCMAPDAPLSATAERTTYRSRGREIQGLLYRPTHPNGAGVVVLHDREGLQRDLPRYEAQLGQLATCGYTVLVPSYFDAGGPRSVNDPLLGDKWKDAVDGAITALGQVRGIDAARIGVWGHGRGGSLALDDGLDGIAAKAVVAVSAGARLDHVRNSPPVLLIAGDHDPDSPIYEAEDLAKEMRKRDVVVTVESVPATLREFQPATWQAVFVETKAFFDVQLAPAG